MASPAAWYPDPGGQAGMFRYWDGTQWSTILSSSPTAPAPGSPGGVDPTKPITLSGAASTLGLTGSGATSAGTPGADTTESDTGFIAAGPAATPHEPTVSATAYNPTPGSIYGQNPYTTPYDPAQSKRRSVGPWVIVVALVLVVGLIAWFAIRQFGGSTPISGNNPVNNPTDQVCPKKGIDWTPVPRPNDGRVYGGQLSYPMMSVPPWSMPQEDLRVPFGVDVNEQIITIHPNYDGGFSDWVISALVGGLNAGDGFYSPQEGSQIVVKCILGVFYGDYPVQSHVQKDEAFTLDGHPGWIVETNLTFSIPNLPTTSELAIIVIVQTSMEMSSIFYASIPNDATRYQPDIEQAMAGLRVES